jgi:hypothetical protein
MAGRTAVLINSLELYRSFGGILGSTLGLSSYCDAMHAEMKPGAGRAQQQCWDGGALSVAARL